MDDIWDRVPVIPVWAFVMSGSGLKDNVRYGVTRVPGDGHGYGTTRAPGV